MTTARQAARTSRRSSLPPATGETRLPPISRRARIGSPRNAGGRAPAPAPRVRERHAWEQAHTSAARALDLHFEHPAVARPPPEIARGIGHGIGH
jgi:hypothetical protein